ncbi:hypothetical protein [Litoreibacter ponti]|uniref:hypothetical protein n=1 Tax=Litoreibacter ponti TaxID=1510457 RepID=UPI0013048E83|nr:hypothetical protein [Litoreibacter ponti]
MRFLHKKTPPRGLRNGAVLTVATLAAGPALGAIEACDRVTHISHGGVADHVDMGAGKVMWTEWWSPEGVYKTVWLADCRTGIALDLRTHEERITERYVRDKTELVRAKITRQAEASPAFFTIDRVAGLIRRDGRDLHIQQYAEEFCACDAAYPNLQGDKTPYEVPS